MRSETKKEKNDGVSELEKRRIQGKEMKFTFFKLEYLKKIGNKIECTTDVGDYYANFSINHLISSVSSLFHSLSLILLFLMRESGNCLISPSSLFHSSF
jgi:hypothetical protein